MKTYSMIALNATLSAPTGQQVNLGFGAGIEAEGVTIRQRLDRQGTVRQGGDGKPMPILKATKWGGFDVKLLKASAQNAILQQLFNEQSANPAIWSQNTFRANDTILGDIITADTVGFTTPPTVTYSEAGEMNTWEFEGRVFVILGAGGE